MGVATPGLGTYINKHHVASHKTLRCSAYPQTSLYILVVPHKAGVNEVTGPCMILLIFCTRNQILRIRFAFLSKGLKFAFFIRNIKFRYFVRFLSKTNY